MFVARMAIVVLMVLSVERQGKVTVTMTRSTQTSWNRLRVNKTALYGR